VIPSGKPITHQSPFFIKSTHHNLALTAIVLVFFWYCFSWLYLVRMIVPIEGGGRFLTIRIVAQPFPVVELALLQDILFLPKTS
jgi:hypothetical protein